MAKKYETSDFDFDKDFALDDFDFDDDRSSKRSKSSRHEELAHAAFKGVGEGLTDNLIESTIRRALPKGYGEALDVFNEGKSSLESLYNSAFKQLKPGLDSAKRLTRQLMPKIDGSLPESVENFLKEWSTEDDSEGADREISPEQQREDLIAMQTGAIWGTQSEIYKRTEEREDARTRIKEGLTQVRHNQEMGALAIIAQNSHRQVQYQDQILAGYQRKSLELQMRQYYATVDHLNVSRKGFMMQKELLESINRSSAMPDFEKTSISGKFHEMARNKFIDKAQNTLFGTDSKFFSEFAENITKSVSEQLSAFGMGLSMSADSASMALDMADSMGEQFDFSAEAATMAGRFAGGKVLEKLQDSAAGKLAKNKDISKTGKKLLHGARNMGHTTEKFLTETGVENDFGEKDWGPLDFLRRFFLSTMPSTKPDLGLTTDKLGDMSQPAPITKQTMKTWNEIIPGFLARIHREIYQLRTGDEKAPLLAYDFTSNRFSTEKNVSNGILRGFLKGGRKDVQKNLTDIMQTAGLGQFRGKAQQDIQRALLDHAMDKGDTSFEGMTKNSSWMGLNPNLRKTVTGAFGKHYGKNAEGEFSDTDEAWTKVIQMDSKFKDLTRSLSDPRAHIQSLVQAGQLEALIRWGVVTPEGQINVKLFKQYLLSTDQVDEDDQFLERNSPTAPKFHNNFQTSSPVHQPQADTGGGQTYTGFDHGAMAGDFSEVRDILKTYPDKYDTMISLLGDINKQLMAGIQTSSIDLEDLQERVRKSRVNPMNWTLGDAIGGTARAAKGLASQVLKGTRRMGNLLGSAGKVGLKVGKDIFYKTADLFNDVWIKGEVKARLTKAKLMAGEYYDEASGQALKSWKDVKGRIVDKDGNLIMDIDEMKDAWVGSKYGRAFKTVISKGVDLAQTLKTGAFTLARSGMTQLFAVKDLVASTWKKYRPAYDVYVKGDQEPSLYKTGFERGLYFDKDTSTALKHPGDIKGPVADKDGNILINDKQLERGLVDVNGVTVGGPLQRGAGLIMNLVTRGVKRAAKAFSQVGGYIGDMLRGVGGLFHDFFGGIFGVRGEFMDNAKLQTDTQLAILKLLEERLPQRKKVVGDADGDGIRENSSEDLRRKRDAKKKEEKESNKSGDAAGKAGLMGGIGGLTDSLKTMFSKAFGKKEEDEDDGLGLDDLADGAILADSAKDLKGSKGKAGRLGRMASGAKKWAGKGFGVGKGMMGRMGAGGGLFGRGLLSVLGGSLTALRFGGGIAAGAVGALASGGVGILGALGAGLLGLVTSPISLVALGLTGAYYGYKYATKARLGTMSRPRMAQYGFQDNEEEMGAALAPIFELERMLEGAVNVTKSGQASLDKTKFKLESVYELFGVKPEDGRKFRNFSTWFNDRFKPIFVAHVSAMRAKFPKQTLKGLDGEKDKKLLIAHLDATAMPDGPYWVSESPVKEIEYLVVGAPGVAAAIELAKAQLEKDQTDSKNRDELKTLGVKVLTGKVGVTDGFNQAMKIGDGKLMPGKLAAATTGAVTAGAASASYLKTDVRQLSALDAVKYRAYGLVTMEADKIIAIKKLEGWLEPQVSWAKNKPSLSVDARTLGEAASPWFGFPGTNSNQGAVWLKWFEQRFRPVFLNYIGGLATYTSKQTITEATRALLTKDALSIANALRGTLSETMFRRSVWEVTDSPWKEYQLNTDPASSDAAIVALTETAKAVLNEQHKKVAKEVNEKAKAQKAALAPKSTGNWATDAVNKVIHSGVDIRKVDIPSNGKGVQAAGDTVVDDNTLVGAGGKYTSLPDSKGNGWQANKDLIVEASKMVGMDPKVMASLIAIESGFKPSARAGTSTATGLGQFIDDTWAGMLKKYGKQYGIPLNTPSTDPKANALMSALFAKDNLKELKTVLDRPVTATDLYMAHFLGAGGAKTFFRAPGDAIAAKVLPKAAGSNKDIFYNGNQARTNDEVYQLLKKRMMGRAADFGVQGSDFGPASLTTPGGDKSSKGNGPKTAAPESILAQDNKTPTAQAKSLEASAPSAPPVIPGTKVPAGVAKPTGPAVPVTVPAPKPSPAKAPVASSEPSAPSVPSTSPDLAEILRRRAQVASVSTQPEASPAAVTRAQVQSEALNKANVNEILKIQNEQLAVQRTMSADLKQILNQMVMKKEALPSAAPSATPATAGAPSGAFARKSPTDMPKPAVSMDR